MEKPKEFKGQKYSILDLIDDGEDLLNAINEAQKSDDPEEVFKKVIKPEIIPVYGKGHKDKITGFVLKRVSNMETFGDILD